MLFPQYHFILASQSPRRQQLLREVGLSFEIIVSHTDESYPDDLPIEQVPEYIALQKAQSVKDRINDPEAIIIAADTIVCLEGEIYGKPYDEFDALFTLRRLSGNKHQVITGVCILSGKKKYTFSVTTHVIFKSLTHDQMQYYIDNYQPYDKAGAYSIQEWIGIVGIERIEGCYFNVVGLPMSRLISALNDFLPI